MYNNIKNIDYAILTIYLYSISRALQHPCNFFDISFH
jgi:hypothetical protein